MRNHPDFTPEQLSFLKSAIFDTLDKDFNYALSDKKRKAVLAKAFDAKNYDALVQRLLNGRFNENMTRSTFDFSVSDKSTNLRNDDFIACLDHIKPADRRWLHDIVEGTESIFLAGCLSALTNNMLIFPAVTFSLIEEKLNLMPEHSALQSIFVAAKEIEANRVVIQLSQNLENNDLVDYSADFTNENCLQGICCPRCQSEGDFMIDTEGLNPERPDDAMENEEVIIYSAIWSDDGSADTYGDTDFPEKGECKCLECGYSSKIEAFQF